jgi:hypothetical protein
LHLRVFTPTPPTLSPLQSLPSQGAPGQLARNEAADTWSRCRNPPTLPHSALAQHLTTMAPIVAETAPAAQRQARRPLSRIVPAIPHRLSRSRNANIPAARPITPDESSKGTVTQSAPEPPPAVDEKPPTEELPQARDAEAPLTPDSRASSENKSEGGLPVLAASPAKSAEDHGHLAVQPPGTSCSTVALRTRKLTLSQTSPRRMGPATTTPLPRPMKLQTGLLPTACIAS